MATMRMISVIVFTLSGGLAPWAGAQQMDSPPPVYSPPSLQEPPPLSSSPRQSRPLTGNTQPYAEPRTSVPIASSRAELEMEMNGSPGWSPPGRLIQVQDYRGIRYASGGVGEGERDELNALSHQFNLRVLFAVQAGNYLADVQVNIVDARGETVLSTQSSGPWFFAQLPPGAYTVDVDALGQTQGQTVRISGARQSRLNFFWR